MRVLELVHMAIGFVFTWTHLIDLVELSLWYLSPVILLWIFGLFSEGEPREVTAFNRYNTEG
mgnify:CR=1 FL=1